MTADRPNSNASLPIDLFDYELPEELIAQQPLADRSASRLLVLERETSEIRHHMFREIGHWLRPGDLLVINDTRVHRARLDARRRSGGRVEFLLVEPLDGGLWRAMARPAKRLRAGEALQLFDVTGNPVDDQLVVMGREDDGYLIVDVPSFYEREEQIGHVPLPHYIGASLDDAERYQTVYAREPGSVAAPTAGLHFTDAMLTELAVQGIDTSRITLHVGPGTFQPVKSADALEHVMHAERYRVEPEALAKIRETRARGGRVIAVGTTSCRTLETIAPRIDDDGPISGSTDLYITPGYRFRLVDGLLTNFHLPRSTLLLLVSAFAGRELVLQAYQEAVESRYRFYSFGDAMLIV